MYHQLRVGFGWETDEKVFAEYRELPKEQWPKTDKEKHDQWMVRFSKASGKNLGPFFQAWGVPERDGAEFDQGFTGVDAGGLAEALEVS